MVLSYQERVLEELLKPHWTAEHIKLREDGQFVVYNEAGLEHGTYDTYWEARDELVVYEAQLRGD